MWTIPNSPQDQRLQDQDRSLQDEDQFLLVWDLSCHKTKVSDHITARLCLVITFCSVTSDTDAYTSDDVRV